MKSVVTQSDVAREAGVTRSMVSYVISGNSSRSVAPATRQRILDAVEKLGYRPNKAAQALQQGDVEFASNRIGLILSDDRVFLRPYYADMIAGIHTAAHEEGYHIAFIRFFNELKNPVLFNTLIHEEEIGGLILMATDQCIKSPEDSQIIERIKSRLRKVVCVEWKYDGLSSVMFDRAETARKAAEHLVSLGYGEIGYIGENDDRIDGVRQALKKSGVFQSEEKLQLASAFDMGGGYAAARKILEEGRVPRAVVCGSDEVAVGVMSAFNEAGVSIPSQVAVISIDNLETSAYTNPPLTTMNVQKNAMGYRAVKMIVDDAVGVDDDAVCVMLPTNIVERKSC